MKDIKIYAHGSYIGNTGYNNHTRDFFRHLNNHCDIKIRNFSIGNSWNGMSITPHDNEPYLIDVDKEMLVQQTLWTTKPHRTDVPMYNYINKNYNHDLNLVLSETNHHYFYDNYDGPKIAYNVWESA